MLRCRLYVKGTETSSNANSVASSTTVGWLGPTVMGLVSLGPATPRSAQKEKAADTRNHAGARNALMGIPLVKIRRGYRIMGEIVHPRYLRRTSHDSTLGTSPKNHDRRAALAGLGGRCRRWRFDRRGARPAPGARRRPAAFCGQPPGRPAARPDAPAAPPPAPRRGGPLRPRPGGRPPL